MNHKNPIRDMKDYERKVQIDCRANTAPTPPLEIKK